MARFAGKKEKETPGLNMGSMSDIIFMLLFFFMVITSMRENTLVTTNVPMGTEVAKLEDPSNACTVYIGVPEDKQKYGTNPVSRSTTSSRKKMTSSPLSRCSVASTAD